MPTDDPAVLFVKDVTKAPESDLKRALHYFGVNDKGDVEERSLSLCGFSFFAEVAGLDPGAATGIDLWSSLDGARAPVESGGRYELTYERYLNYLSEKGINYLRLFLFNQQVVRLYPFVGRRDQNTGRIRYQLDQVDAGFTNRLAEFVGEARARGIVVCISLCATQVLKPAGFLNSPFYYKNNWNGVIERFTDGRGRFCDIQRPPDLAAYDNTWPVSQKLYFIQYNLYKSVVAATKPYWNVVYEIFNEPFTDTNKVVEWHQTVATWLNDFLKDAKGRRTRLISVTATDRLLDAIIAAVRGLADFISLHGSQWGGPPGEVVNLCESNDVPGAEAIRDGIQEAITRFRERGLAVLFDGDSLYWSQRAPTEYVNQVLLRNGCFNFRWNEEFLDKVITPKPGETPGETYDYCRDLLTNGKPTLGLGQRLELISQAANFNKVTGLPKAPAPVPKNLTATPEGNYLRLSFGRPAPPPPKSLDPDTTPEGYVAYFGPTPETLGLGTAIFPRRKFFKVQDPANPRYDVLFYPEGETEVYVAVAARNGILTGEPSNVVRVAIPYGVFNSELVSADLPVGRGRQIPDRYFSGSMTFKNTGTRIWKRQYTASDGWTATTGVYMQCVEVGNASGRVLVPLPVEQVLPGQTVTIPFQRVFLPYSRSPLHFNLGMGRYRVNQAASAWGHFGKVYQVIPPDTPVEVRVTNPKRHATLMLTRDDVSVPAGVSYLDHETLSSDPDYANYDLLSVATAATANPGTVIRPSVRIETIGGRRTSRVVRVSHNAAAALPVNLKVVRLDAKDVDNPRHPDTLGRGYDLAPNGSAVGSLSRFENLCAISTASSSTPLPAGQSLTWEIMLKSGTAPLKQLLVRNRSTVPAQITTWTNEIWEDVPAGETDPRQLRGTLAFGAGETVKYVKLSNANEHHFHAVHLRSDGSAEVHFNVVLRANAHRAFERVLEVGVGAHAQTVRVDYWALDIVVDA